MSQFEDPKAMFAVMSAQSFLLTELYAYFFAADPDARKAVPESLVRMAMFRQHPPNGDIGEDAMVDIHAHVVLNLVTFFKQVEARLQAEPIGSAAA